MSRGLGDVYKRQLMSKVSFQEGSSVPGIAQAVVIEREEDV